MSDRCWCCDRLGDCDRFCDDCRGCDYPHSCRIRRTDFCPQCRSGDYDVDNDICAVCEAAWESWVMDEMQKVYA